MTKRKHEKNAMNSKRLSKVILILFIQCFWGVSLPSFTMSQMLPSLYIYDSFDGATIDTSKWDLINDSYNNPAIFSQTSGSLVIQAPPYLFPPLRGMIQSTATFRGDFDFVADYSNWDYQGAVQYINDIPKIGLQVSTLEQNAFNIAWILRGIEPSPDGGQNVYTGNVKINNGSEEYQYPNLKRVLTSDTSGSLRLERIGPQLNAYYWSSNQWNILYSYPNYGTSDVRVSLNGSKGDVQDATFYVKFDQLNIVKGTVVPTMPELTLDELKILLPWHFDYSGDYKSIESIYSVVSHCMTNPSYTSECAKAGYCYYINGNVSFHNLPVMHLEGRSLFTAWLDATWDNLIPNSGIAGNKFNTVFKGNPQSGEKFEVISRIDLANTPIDGTDNLRSYFFTYTTKTDSDNSRAVTMTEWIDYLSAIRTEYKRPIDILTIFAHGKPGCVNMSDAFQLTTDPATQLGMKRLRDEHILSPCGTILLFSCLVGQDSQFVQNLANWSGATVYANSQYTGDMQTKCTSSGCVVTSDWNLDVIRIPDNDVMNREQCDNNLKAPLRASDDIDCMFPGGIRVVIAPNVLTGDGQLTVTNTLTGLADLGVDTSSMKILSAYSVSLEGTILRDQMTIEVSFPLNADLSGLSAKDIKLMYWDETLRKWSTNGISDVRVDIVNRYVSFRTSHTTIFAAVVNKIEFNGFLPPIGGADIAGGSLTAPIKAFKLKSTVPIKMILTSGTIPKTTGTHTIQLFKVSSGTILESAIDATPADAATLGNAFRLADATTGEWHFNLNTDALSKGIWQIKVTLSDMTTHTAFIELK